MSFVSQPVSPAVSQPFSAGHAAVADSELLGRRLGRVAAGAVLALGPFIVMAQSFIVHQLERHPVLTTPPLIALLWLSALVAYRLARRFGRSNAALAFFDDDAFSGLSYAVPAVGVAFVAPISVHAIIGLPLWALGMIFGDTKTIEAFDGWVVLALYGTLHVHLIFAVLLARASQLAARGEVPKSIKLWPCVLASLVPGAIILFPPLLVWVTGLIVSRLFLKQAARWSDDDDAVTI